MAITAVNASYLTQGPAVSGQILANNAKSATETALVYTALVTLDGASTTFTLNFIDGTQTLSFTPSAVTASIVGGTATNVPAIATTTPTNTGVTVNLSAAGTASTTLLITGFILR